MNTLFDLTGKRTGIVLHRGRPPIACDWSRIMGLPRRLGNEVHGVGEPIPKVLGHWYDSLEEWTEVLKFPGRPEPQRGWVYMIGDTVVIAPDEWE